MNINPAGRCSTFDVTIFLTDVLRERLRALCVENRFYTEDTEEEHKGYQVVEFSNFLIVSGVRWVKI